MKKAFTTFLLLLGLVFLFGGNNGSVVLHADETNVSINGLQFHEAEHFNLQEVSDFVQFDDLFLFVENGTLNAYSTRNKTTYSFSQYQNVTNLTSQGSVVAFLNGTEFVILNSSLVFQALTLNGNNTAYNASLFALTYENSTYTLALLNGNVFTTLTFNNSFEILSSNQTNLVGVTSASSLTLGNGFAYLAHNPAGGAYYYMQIALSNLTVQNLPTDILKTTNLTFAKLYDKNLLFAVSNNSSLYVLEITPEQPNYYTTLLQLTSSGFLTPSFVKGNFRRITSLKTTANGVQILDTENKAIQEFVLEQNPYALTCEKVLFASNGYEPGLFYGVEEITAISNNTLLVADTQNNRIQLLNQNSNVVLSQVVSGGITTNLTQPKSVKLNSNNQFVLHHKPNGNNQVLVVNQNGNVATVLQTVQANETTNPLGELTNLTLTYDHKLFALDVTNNQILFSNQYQTFTPLVVTPFETPLTSSSLLAVTSQNQLVVYHNETLHLLNLQGEILFSLPTNEPITSFTTDYFGNVFALNQNTILKFAIENNQIAFEESKTYNIPQTVTKLSVATDSGKLFAYNPVNEQLISITNETFSKGMQEFVHPVNPLTTVANSQFTKVAQMNQNSFAYAYPYQLGTSYELNQNDQLFVLNESDYSEFAFVLFAQNNILTMGYVAKSTYTQTNFTTYDESEQLITIHHNVTVFKFPTLLQAQNNKAVLLQTVSVNTLLTPLTEQIVGLGDGATYYAVQLNGGIGYVNYADVVFSNYQSIVEFETPNQTIFHISGTTKVYASENTNSTLLAQLNNFTQVYAEQFNPQQPFTKIVFQDDFNNQVVGYIETSHIWQEDENKNTTALVLLLGGLLLLSLTIFAIVKNKKQHEV